MPPGPRAPLSFVSPERRRAVWRCGATCVLRARLGIKAAARRGIRNMIRRRVVVSFYATALSLFLEDRSGVLQPTFGTPCTAVYKLVIRLAVASGAWALARPECGTAVRAVNIGCLLAPASVLFVKGEL